MKNKLLLPAILIPFFFASCDKNKTEEVKAEGDKAVAEAIENAEAATTEVAEATGEAVEEAINEVEEAAGAIEEAVEEAIEQARQAPEVE